VQCRRSEHARRAAQQRENVAQRQFSMLVRRVCRTNMFIETHMPHPSSALILNAVDTRTRVCEGNGCSNAPRVGTFQPEEASWALISAPVIDKECKEHCKHRHMQKQQLPHTHEHADTERLASCHAGLTLAFSSRASLNLGLRSSSQRTRSCGTAPCAMVVLSIDQFLSG